MRLLCALLTSAAALAAQTIAGVVVNSVTGAGVPDARVQIVKLPLFSAGGGRVSQATPYQRVANTDAAGSFRFTDLDDGDYIVAGSKANFRLQSGLTVHVSAGTDTERPRLLLVPYGRISGRVLDGNGRPVSDASLELAGPGPVKPGASGADGSFAFEQLLPARYTLLARPPRDWQPPDSVDGQEFAWAPTFYPKLALSAGGAPILIGVGTEAQDVDIKLLAAPLRHIRGVVLSPHGDPAPHATVRLADAAEKRMVEETVEAGNDGAFDFTAIDGAWRLGAEAAAGETDLGALETIEVKGHHVEDVRLRLTPPFSISGSVSYDPPPPRDGPKPPPVRIALEGPGRVTTEVAVVEESGRFTIEKVFPGIYTVRIAGVNNGISLNQMSFPVSSQPYYLASATWGSQDALRRDVEILSGEQSLDIRIQAYGGTVRGHVADCNGAMVTLQPQEPWLVTTAFVRTVRCDADGHFEISPVRPGDYYVAALDWEYVAANMIGLGLDPNTLPRATAITIRPSETSSVDLRVIK